MSSLLGAKFSVRGRLMAMMKDSAGSKTGNLTAEEIAIVKDKMKAYGTQSKGLVTLQQFTQVNIIELQTPQ